MDQVQVNRFTVVSTLLVGIDMVVRRACSMLYDSKDTVCSGKCIQLIEWTCLHLRGGNINENRPSAEWRTKMAAEARTVAKVGDGNKFGPSAALAVAALMRLAQRELMAVAALVE
eukprot:g46346.t1